MLKIKKKIPSNEICTYYKERYDEAYVTYRRLEDKVNYMFAALAMEVSVLIALYGAAFGVLDNLESLSIKLFVLFSAGCCACVGFSMFYLGRTWELKLMPKMPSPRTEASHKGIFNSSEKVIHRHFVVFYSKAVFKIEELHTTKATYANKLFLSLALSYGFFVISLISLISGKI